MLTEIIHKYLIEDDDLCIHCHKGKKEKGGSMCSKCIKELKTFRAKINKGKD